MVKKELSFLSGLREIKAPGAAPQKRLATFFQKPGGGTWTWHANCVDESLAFGTLPATRRKLSSR